MIRRGRASGALSGALLALLAASAQAASPFVELLRKAESRSAEDPERVEYASRALRAWVPADGKPLLAHAHFARAEGCAARLDETSAEEDLTRVLDLDTFNYRARLMRASARAALGRGAEAEKDALEYLSSRPEDPEGWLALGEARLVQGSARAREAFAKAAALLSADDPRPRLGEGKARLAARRYPEALAAFSAALERPRGFRADILDWRARAYAASGDWRAARQDLDETLPELERSMEDRRRSGASERGVQAAVRSVADALFRRGLAHEALKERADALSDHRAACGHGHAPACARVKTLEKAGEPRPAQRAPVPPQRRAPKSDPGERVYAN